MAEKIKFLKQIAASCALVAIVSVGLFGFLGMMGEGHDHPICRGQNALAQECGRVDDAVNQTIHHLTAYRSFTLMTPLIALVAFALICAARAFAREIALLPDTRLIPALLRRRAMIPYRRACALRRWCTIVRFSDEQPA